jgi:glutamate---cysteine ligase / carboxylate-amine ligase
MTAALSGESLRRRFDAPAAPTVGIEEELMLLDPDGHDLLPRADDVLARVRDDPRFKGELPASQIEALTRPAEDLEQAAAQLTAARADLSRAADGIGILAAAGAHPFTDPEGALSDEKRYGRTRAEYGRIARMQLVFGLHVHIRISGADRALAVYNGLRSFLPELAALAANAPFFVGHGSGLASIRPEIAALLPRQGVPPPFRDLEEVASAFAWGRRSGAYPDERQWWWELRLHPVFGTVEVRVPDQQTTVRETIAVAALAHSLALHLAERFDAGDPAAIHPSWRISENRWSAARHGLEGTMADLETGEPCSTRERVLALIDTVEKAATRRTTAHALGDARKLAERNGAMRQREVAESDGIRGVVDDLARRFLA